jgi:hypothetical protein
VIVKDDSIGSVEWVISVVRAHQHAAGTRDLVDGLIEDP